MLRRTLLVVTGVSLFFKPFTGISQAQAEAIALTITVAPTPPQPSVISTRNQVLTLRTISGQAVALSKASGREPQLVASGGFAWTQVQEVSARQSSLTLTPKLLESGQIQVVIDRLEKVADAVERLQTTVVVMPGEWVQIVGNPSRDADNGRISTRRGITDTLFIKVDR